MWACVSAAAAAALWSQGTSHQPGYYPPQKQCVLYRGESKCDVNSSHGALFMQNKCCKAKLRLMPSAPHEPRRMTTSDAVLHTHILTPVAETATCVFEVTLYTHQHYGLRGNAAMLSAEGRESKQRSSNQVILLPLDKRKLNGNCKNFRKIRKQFKKFINQGCTLTLQ